MLARVTRTMRERLLTGGWGKTRTGRRRAKATGMNQTWILKTWCDCTVRPHFSRVQGARVNSPRVRLPGAAQISPHA
jgi:hypothetical protein